MLGQHFSWLYKHIFSAQKEFNKINEVSSFVNCIFVFLILKGFPVFNWLRQSVSCLLQYGLCRLFQLLYHYYQQWFQYFLEDQQFPQRPINFYSLTNHVLKGCLFKEDRHILIIMLFLLTRSISFHTAVLLQSLKKQLPFYTTKGKCFFYAFVLYLESK